jgi:uncharacterized protein (DUF983 family)
MSEKTIIYQCPNCGQEMIGQCFNGIFKDKWVCEYCGYHGLHANAYLRYALNVNSGNMAIVLILKLKSGEIFGCVPIRKKRLVIAIRG